MQKMNKTNSQQMVSGENFQVILFDEVLSFPGKSF